MMSEHKKYMCIHCSKEFDKVPLERPNECPYAYTHTIIKGSAIVKRKRADPYVKESWLLENEGKTQS